MSTGASIVLLIIAYLLGAIPVGVILGRVFCKKDIRTVGSGSTGTTNALRAFGPKISIAVLVFDVLKGALPVIVARAFGANPWVIGLAAVLTVVGHCWSPFIEFDGGKGVATGGGALIALQPWVAFALLLMLAIVVWTRYVSLGSIVTAIAIGLALSLAALGDREPPAIAVCAVAIATIIVWRHKGNIQRLLNGSERRISLRKAAPAGVS
ncbi:MAG TPA: glycerol-3-phosphate 1-O-acyltransferase PlsY [Thermomicrobiales bacterium]|nr:glycerol-3-phosphate 1-O-acyltransferase PlsY [Thermomicrobiales bacterium]HRA47328.1 glycerol-3-phosphate 1-O-acyltransferase PlsY [Thermomicrobiales bacterium]